MNLDTALRATEVLMALAFIQQSAEHLATTPSHRVLFALRMLLCVLLLVGLWPAGVLAGLAVISIIMLERFQGPYNGGSDRMSVLILWCLLGARVMPELLWQEAFFGYLAFQLTLSYFIAGKVKLQNSDWRHGQSLHDVFAFSAYPVSENLRGLAKRRTLLWLMSWAVILFEVCFPLALLNPNALVVALGIGTSFHLANAYFFGLNRFFWIWIAAYPSLIWFQNRIF